MGCGGLNIIPMAPLPYCGGLNIIPMAPLPYCGGLNIIPALKKNYFETTFLVITTCLMDLAR